MTLDRAKEFFGYAEYKINGIPIPEVSNHFAEQAARFAASETAEIREALVGLVNVIENECACHLVRSSDAKANAEQFLEVETD